VVCHASVRRSRQRWPKYSYPKPTLAGVHQWPNAMLAAVALQKIAEKIPQAGKLIGKGIATARWPARLQKLPSLHPVRQALPMGSQLWLDGGHNAAAAGVIADWMHAQEGQKFWLIWGMLRNKDAEGFLRPLLPYLAGVVAVPVVSEMPTYRAAELAAIARKMNVATVGEGSDVLAAAQWIDAQQPDREAHVLIAGSLYLAGDVLALHGAPE
jgi:dihydrofolate synthase/folylpolyglutamate synthase